MIFGGEALELQSLRPWFDRHGDVLPQLVNMYGITETTVHVTYRPLSRVDLEAGGSVIGGPIPDLKIYLLDAFQQPVPISVTGEIYVGGAGVARGYLNRPELTAERFVPDPFSPAVRAPCCIVPATSARWRPNGDARIPRPHRPSGEDPRFPHRARRDRGRAALRIRPCAPRWCCVREDRAGRQADRGLRPVARGRRGGSSRNCASTCSTRVPDYMVPAAIVLLDAFPLTPNGKVDRRALPAPEAAPAAVTRPERGAGMSSRRRSRGSGARRSGVEQVGRDDNFFDLGGHSLLVVQVHRRLRAALGCELSVVDLFKFPTVARRWPSTCGRHAAAGEATLDEARSARASRPRRGSGVGRAGGSTA